MTKTDNIYGEFGKQLGSVRTDDNGGKTIHGEGGKQLGSYDAHTNQTKDTTGHVIGSGDQSFRFFSK
jgi:hypothetical protein